MQRCYRVVAKSYTFGCRHVSRVLSYENSLKVQGRYGIERVRGVVFPVFVKNAGLYLG